MPPSRESAFVSVVILIMLSSFILYPTTANISPDAESSVMETKTTKVHVDNFRFIEGDASYAIPTWTHTTTNPEYVRPITISSDGSTIVEAAGNFLRILNSSSNQSLWTYEAESTLIDCAISEDGELIAGSTMSGLLILFDRSSNSPLWISNCSGFVYSIDISNNGTNIAASDTSGCIYAYSHLSNESVWKYNTTQPILSVAISGDGSTIIAANTNKTVCVFDYFSNQTLWTYQFLDAVGSVSVCNNGTYLAVGSQEGTFLFTRNSNQSLWSYVDEFDFAEISNDASTIAATNSENNTHTLFLWDSGSNQTLWKYNGTERFTKVSMSETGSRIIAGGYGNETVIFNRYSNNSDIRHPCESFIIDVAITSEGHSFATSCGDGHTYYFSLVGPTFISVETNKVYYNASEEAVISAVIQKGTADLVECILWYSSDGVDWNSKGMVNENPLTDSIITFNTSLNTFSSNITYYITVHDKLEFENSTVESHIVIDNLNPLILDPVHTPSSPTSTDDVVINVNVTDSLSGVQVVMINFRNSSLSEWTQEEMTYSGNSVYTTTLAKLPNGTVVQYYFEATDSVGNTYENDNSGNYFEYIVLDEPTSTSSQTTSTTSTIPPPDSSGLIYVVALIVSIVSGTTIMIVYIFRRRTAIGKVATSITENPTDTSVLEEETMENNLGERD